MVTGRRSQLRSAGFALGSGQALLTGSSSWRARWACSCSVSPGQSKCSTSSRHCAARWRQPGASCSSRSSAASMPWRWPRRASRKSMRACSSGSAVVSAGSAGGAVQLGVASSATHSSGSTRCSAASSSLSITGLSTKPWQPAACSLSAWFSNALADTITIGSVCQPQLADAARGGPAVHVVHRDVQQHRVGLLLQHALQALDAAGGLAHAKAQRHQQAGQHLALGGLVVHHQQRAARTR